MALFQESNVDHNRQQGKAFHRKMSEMEHASNFEHEMFHQKVTGQGSFEREISYQKVTPLPNLEREISYQKVTPLPNFEREIAQQQVTEGEQQRQLLREQYKRCEDVVSALSADTMEELAHREREIERLQRELAQIMAKTLHNGSEDHRARKERMLEDENTHLLDELNRMYAIRYDDAVDMQKLVQERKDVYRQLHEFEEERQGTQAKQEGIQKTLDHLQWQLAEEQERRGESDKRVRQLEQDMEEHKRRLHALSDGASSAHSRIHDALSAARITESRLREVAKPHSPPVWTRQTKPLVQKPLNAEFLAQIDTPAHYELYPLNAHNTTPPARTEPSPLTAHSTTPPTNSRPFSSSHRAITPTHNGPLPFSSHQTRTPAPNELSPVTAYSTTPPTHSRPFPSSRHAVTPPHNEPPFTAHSTTPPTHNEPFPFSSCHATAPTHNTPSSFSSWNGTLAPRATPTRATDAFKFNQRNSATTLQKPADSLYANSRSTRDNSSKCAALRTYADAAPYRARTSSNTSTSGSSSADIHAAKFMHAKLTDTHGNSAPLSTSASAHSSDRTSTARGDETVAVRELQYKAKKKHTDRMARRLHEEIGRTTRLLASALDGDSWESDDRRILNIEQSV